MKKRLMVISLGIALLLTGCGQSASNSTGAVDTIDQEAVQAEASQAQSNAGSETIAEAVAIFLSDDSMTVDGEAIPTDSTAAVYAANDIVYYEEGKDFTYGEGTADDEHSKEEADSHTVVHITQPGTYAVSGKLSAGQIAVDLGEDAKEDPEAVVTLILNGVDINCSVAPAVIFYRVYECGSTEEADATKDVDTSDAGANVIIADGTENNITGSYVARIYKSVELNEDGTEVVDSKKLHKYDGAFYSKMSMNVNGGEEGSGVLNITAENEGLDSELHLTINGGNINITSGNDGINTNEDGISVTTINGGTLNITVDGATGEGDGIDSNGWLVINGGTVIASACAFSADAGIDSDMGIHINGGTVIATGNMLDQISESTQNYVVFSFAGKQSGGAAYFLKDSNGDVVAEAEPENDFTYLIFSAADMAEGTYSLWREETQLAGYAGGAMMEGAFGRGGKGAHPDGMERFDQTEPPEGVEMPEIEMSGNAAEMPEIFGKPEAEGNPDGMGRSVPFYEAEPSEDMKIPEGMEPPEGMERPDEADLPEDAERPEGSKGNGGNRGEMSNAEVSVDFAVAAGGNYFSNVREAE